MNKQIKQLLLMVLAILILATSVNMFLGPHHIAAGGVSGIGILVESLLGINRAWVVMGLNVVMLILAAIFLGKQVFLRTLLGTGCLRLRQQRLIIFLVVCHCLLLSAVTMQMERCC